MLTQGPLLFAIVLACETDFVAMNDSLRKVLAKDFANLLQLTCDTNKEEFLSC